MTPKTRVAVCGGSLTMAGLAVSLEVSLDVDVVRIQTITAALAQYRDEQATVIVFDLSELSRDLALELLRERPGLLLIGVDPDSDRLLVISGHAEQAASAADLVRIIYQKQPGSEEARGGIP